MNKDELIEQFSDELEQTKVLYYELTGKENGVTPAALAKLEEANRALRELTFQVT